MLPVFFRILVHTNSKKIKTKLTEKYSDTSVQLKLEAPPVYMSYTGRGSLYFIFYIFIATISLTVREKED